MKPSEAGAVNGRNRGGRLYLCSSGGGGGGGGGDVKVGQGGGY